MNEEAVAAGIDGGVEGHGRAEHLEGQVVVVGDVERRGVRVDQVGLHRHDGVAGGRIDDESDGFDASRGDQKAVGMTPQMEQGGRWAHGGLLTRGDAGRAKNDAGPGRTRPCVK